MPFLQTAAAAAGTGMLSFEHRVPTHGRLLAIVLRMRGRKTFSNKVARVLSQANLTYAVYISDIRRR